MIGHSREGAELELHRGFKAGLALQKIHGRLNSLDLVCLIGIEFEFHNEYLYRLKPTVLHDIVSQRICEGYVADNEQVVSTQAQFPFQRLDGLEIELGI